FRLVDLGGEMVAQISLAGPSVVAEGTLRTVDQSETAFDEGRLPQGQQQVGIALNRGEGAEEDRDFFVRQSDELLRGISQRANFKYTRLLVKDGALVGAGGKTLIEMCVRGQFRDGRKRQELTTAVHSPQEVVSAQSCDLQVALQGIAAGRHLGGGRALCG